MPLNDTVARVTQRIRERSADPRSAYLDRMARTLVSRGVDVTIHAIQLVQQIAT